MTRMMKRLRMYRVKESRMLNTRGDVSPGKVQASEVRGRGKNKFQVYAGLTSKRVQMYSSWFKREQGLGAPSSPPNKI